MEVYGVGEGGSKKVDGLVDSDASRPAVHLVARSAFRSLHDGA